MAPDCSFDEDFIPYLTGHNVFNSPGIKHRSKSTCVRNKTATLFTIDAYKNATIFTIDTYMSATLLIHFH